MRELLVKNTMVKSRLCATLSTQSSTKHDYEDAIKLINSLQTNAALLEQYKKSGPRSEQAQASNIADTRKYLARIGISQDQLDNLSVIHVAGTKGKGSTCAFCESILRHHGFKTGFFSSPHLISVTERIRINGRPINAKDFSFYVHKVYKELVAKKEKDDDMPPYFKFLTLVAFQAFLTENIDVAIVEVGIGGEYDCTNVLRKVHSVGITSLGIDHTNLLGNTLAKIAWQKSGIMKPGSVSFTTNNQPKEAMTVLQARSIERQCPLFIAPPLESYDWTQFTPDLGIQSNVQRVNASLALQLANQWMRNHRSNVSMVQLKEESSKAKTFPITAAMADGLKYCQWPGRTQVLKRDGINYYIDGAHTVESMQVCTEWFLQGSQPRSPSIKRALIFNATGDRNSTTLLEMLFRIKFDLVIFCPNIVTVVQNDSSDLTNFMVTDEQQKVRCEKHRSIWLKFQERGAAGDMNCNFLDTASVKQTSCVSAALELIQVETEKYDVLVTGSLHLVGAVLSLLDPELTSMTHKLPPELRENKSENTLHS